MDFYRDVFPEGSFEERGVFEDGNIMVSRLRLRKAASAQSV